MNQFRLLNVTSDAYGPRRWWWWHSGCFRAAKDTVECAARNTARDSTLNSARHAATDSARWGTRLYNFRDIVWYRRWRHKFWLLLNRLRPLLHDWDRFAGRSCFGRNVLDLFRCNGNGCRWRGRKRRRHM